MKLFGLFPSTGTQTTLNNHIVKTQFDKKLSFSNTYFVDFDIAPSKNVTKVNVCINDDNKITVFVDGELLDFTKKDNLCKCGGICQVI
jgi:hypothetical protein